MKIKNVLKSILGFLIYIKIYISRTVSWISLVTNLGILFLVIEKLNSLGILKSDLGNSIMAIMVVWFVFLVALGWLEVNKAKAPHLEAIKMLELNPPMKDMYLKTRDNNERLKKIEEWIDNNHSQQSPGKDIRSKELGLQSEDSSVDNSQQKQVKSVPREDDYFSKSKAYPDNVDSNNQEGKDDKSTNKT